MDDRQDNSDLLDPAELMEILGSTDPAAGSKTPETPRPQSPREIWAVQTEKVKAKLKRKTITKNGGVIELPGFAVCEDNLYTIMSDDPGLGPRLRTNTRNHRIYWDQGEGYRPILLEADFSDMLRMISHTYGTSYQYRDVRRNAISVAAKQEYDPIRDWLDTLTWDGVSRTDELADKIWGVDPEKQPLARIVARKFLLAMVARVYDPGCKQDECLVLVGQQGTRKSTFLETMAGPGNYSAMLSLKGLESVDALMAMHKSWLTEIPEIDGVTSKTDAAALKRVLSNCVDTMRRPYAANTEGYPRQFVLAGTSNNPDLLSDPTGSRRWWIVYTGANNIDIEYLKDIRDQLFAEAVAAYRAGEQHNLTPEQDKLNRQNNSDHYEKQNDLEDILQDAMERIEYAYQVAIRAGKPGLGMMDILRVLALPDGIRLTPTGVGRAIAPQLRKRGWGQVNTQVNGVRSRYWCQPGVTPTQNPCVALEVIPGQGAVMVTRN